MKYVLILLAAYFLGAIPWAYIMGKATKGIDIREYGSGNVGFTNALRTMGKFPALVVLLGDVGKGFLAVYLAKIYGGPVLATLAGLTVVAGHNYPIFLRFKGGKGAAAGFGAVLGLVPLVAGIAIFVWASTVFFTRYVSLGSILGALTVPVASILLKEDVSYIIFGLIGASLVIFKHRTNIVRLAAGTENRIGERTR